MSHIIFKEGDYLVARKEANSRYSWTTTTELMVVTADKKSGDGSVKVKPILTVSKGEIKKKPVRQGSVTDVGASRFKIANSYDDLTEELKKGLKDGDFFGKLPPKFVPFEIEEICDFYGDPIKVGDFVIGASNTLYEVEKLHPDNVFETKIFLGELVPEKLRGLNFTACKKWNPFYKLGDEVFVDGRSTKYIVSRVSVKKDSSGESLLYQVYNTETKRYFLYNMRDLSRYYKKDSAKEGSKKKTPIKDKVDERVFRKGFFGVISSAYEKGLVGEIIYLNKDTKFKDMPEDVMSLNGKVFKKDTVSYTPITDVPYTRGPVLTDDYDVDAEKICTINSIIYNKTTSSIDIGYIVDKVSRVSSIGAFGYFLADAVAKAKLNNSEKQGKKTMKTAPKVTAMQKMMDKMFKKVENVVLDMATGGVGIRRGDSIFSLSSEKVDDKTEYCVGENMFEQLSFDIPAFAQATPLTKVKEGDLVLNASGAPHGWAIKINEKSMKVLKMDGSVSNVVPSKVLMMGAGQTVMVVSSLGGDQMGNMLPMLMLMDEKGSDGSALDKLLPLMMMQGMGGDNPMGGMMSNPMMMMMMLKDDDTEGLFSDPMMMMAMSGMMGGGAAQGDSAQAGMMGGMMGNPLMMMMLLKK